MGIPSFKSYRCHARQTGQGMTEYIIILAVIAISSIFVYTQFGDTLRHQTAAAAKVTCLDFSHHGALEMGLS